VRTLEECPPIVGNEVTANLHRKARSLYGATVVHVKTPFQAGGPAQCRKTSCPSRD
jgi:hypothetical protein